MKLFITGSDGNVNMATDTGLGVYIFRQMTHEVKNTIFSEI